MMYITKLKIKYNELKNNKCYNCLDITEKYNNINKYYTILQNDFKN